jgi:predicted rRNA methylase YqxC with S4 and FtsJ domains
MVKRERADLLLVARGLFESRARAQAAIAAGRVTADGSVIRKPSDEISSIAVITAVPAQSVCIARRRQAHGSTRSFVDQRHRSGLP